LQQIRDAKCRVGLTLNPDTDFQLVEPFLDQIDLLLVMTVHPGFGGQSFRPEQMDKVSRVAKWSESRDRRIDIEVDGGINSETARVSIENGANVLVAGTSIFKTSDYAKAIRDLRGG
jgi:ribulose-phosphate 3-epimerase